MRVLSFSPLSLCVYLLGFARYRQLYDILCESQDLFLPIHSRKLSFASFSRCCFLFFLNPFKSDLILSSVSCAFFSLGSDMEWIQCLERELNVDEFNNDGTGCFNFPIKFYEICESKEENDAVVIQSSHAKQAMGFLLFILTYSTTCFATTYWDNKKRARTKRCESTQKVIQNKSTSDVFRNVRNAVVGMEMTECGQGSCALFSITRWHLIQIFLLKLGTTWINSIMQMLCQFWTRIQCATNDEPNEVSGTTTTTTTTGTWQNAKHVFLNNKAHWLNHWKWMRKRASGAHTAPQNPSYKRAIRMESRKKIVYFFWRYVKSET